MKNIKQATREWDIEVENEAVRLIEDGMPPFDAVDQARENVSRRRRAESQRGINDILGRVPK